MDSWGDGWTIYVWLIAGAMIIVAVMYWIRWAAKNDQFDEDIKYVVFDEDDKDKMSSEEFQKAMNVNKAQEELREEYLEKERAEHQASKN
jgi:cbb3-type cytochrome oxidase subunit 3